MNRAISLNNYFNNQVFSLYSELTNDDELAPQLVKVLEILEKQNGFASA
ncbi:MAG: hypothetical protein HC930_16500 [Hydrococcus sp. SU_1_0]|nr:hypothetical protein [Hydrococcus sp. SU_1_0]